MENNEEKICVECGEHTTGYEIVNEEIFCNDCYNNRFRTCEDCGELIDLDNDDYARVETDGAYYCENCRDNNNVFFCEDCGEFYYEDDMIMYQDTDKYVCESCAERNGYRCNDCGEWYEYADEGVTTHDGDWVCRNCSDSYYTCDSCGEVYHENDMHYDDSDGCSYCDNCYGDDTNRVLSYHEFSDWHPYKTESEKTPPFYIGFENEVENSGGYYTNDAVGYITSNLNAICSHDGSLRNGFEIVSHPQSFNYILENQDKIKNVFEQLQKWGFKSHDTTTCGLHFHVTRPNEDVIDKIWLVMETYKEELIKFSRRTIDTQTHWASFLSDRGINDKESKSLYFIKKSKGNFNRYMALNIENANTIEFRIFKGTLNFNTFMASVELVNNIVTMCSDVNIKVTDITWSKLTGTPYAKEYCASRNIISNKKIKDNSLELLKQVNKKKAIFKKILKIVNNSAIEYYQKNVARVNKDFTTIEMIETCKKYEDNYYKMETLKNILRSISGEIGNETLNKIYTLNNIKTMFENYMINEENYNTILELLKEVE